MTATAAGPISPAAVRPRLRLVDRLADHLNPVFVREVQQALNSRTFIVLVILALLAMAAIVATATRIAGTTLGLGQAVFEMSYTTLWAILVLIVPLQAMNAMRVEMAAGTAELLTLANLSPGGIIRGKLSAALVQSVLWLSLVAPLLGLTVIMRGVSLEQIGDGIVIIAATSLAATAVGLWLGTWRRWRPRNPLKITFSILGLLIFAPLALAVFIASFEYSQTVGPGYYRFWTLTPSLVVFSIVFVIGTFATRSVLAPPPDNRGALLRLLRFPERKIQLANAFVEARSLSRSFGRLRAVDRMSFELGRGVVYAFIGPNGAGKTTTMRMLATLDLPHAGDAKIGGVSIIQQPRAARKRVGFMSDALVPYANLSVREFLDFFARCSGLRGALRHERIEAVSSFCGLGDFATRPATRLSKGMGQRLHLAKTLLHDPELLILDEPTAGLDPRARVDFRELVRELAARGKTVLVSSHILSELAEMCDGAIVVERGRKVAGGTMAELARGVTGATRVEARVLRDAKRAERFLLVQPFVVDVAAVDGVVDFEFEGDDAALADLWSRAVGADLGIVEFGMARVDLEAIFMSSTKGRLQ